ncbi:MAG: hypothetical protein AAGF85_19830 [Bacteroidota bacterium]
MDLARIIIQILSFALRKEISSFLKPRGDVYDNDDSRNKNILGKTWAEKLGSNFKYFMVFGDKEIENAYTARSVIEVLKGL